MFSSQTSSFFDLLVRTNYFINFFKNLEIPLWELKKENDKEKIFQLPANYIEFQGIFKDNSKD